MNTKILNSEERNKLKQIIDKILEPIRGTIEIAKNYHIMHHSVTVGHDDRKEWDEYYYYINIKTDLGNYDFSERFNDLGDYTDLDLSAIAWNIAYEIFNKLDRNFDSLLAQNLWPKDNKRMPDYNRFI